MTVRYFDLLPTPDARYVLRAKSNGSIVLKSMDGQSEASFIQECDDYISNKSTPERPARLRVFDDEGRER